MQSKSRFKLLGGAVSLFITLFLVVLPRLAAAASVSAAFSDHFADVNGVRLHYRVGGTGSPVVLLHGYAQTSHMWNELMPILAEHHTVIVPDLRGAGGSSKPKSGYDKKNMALDIYELTTSLGLDGVSIVGHDIGLMVAYAYAAQFPQATDQVVLMDAFLPGIGNWKDVWLMRDLWHFHFYGEVPLALVKGRERTYFEHFWNDFAADPKRSVPEADRRVYAKAYSQSDGMRAGFEYFRNFERDADDFGHLSATPLAMPVLVLTGEKASGQFLIEQARLVARNVKGVVIQGSGHWLIDEAFDQVAPQIVAFLDGGGSSRRLNPDEISKIAPKVAGAGTSGLTEIRTRVLYGDPSQSGPYTIQLEVPANTRIEAHDHPDERVATVVSGTWYFGYGDHFTESKLKPLAQESFYTEPPNVPHFARTGDSPAVVRISGLGPTGTTYVKTTRAAE
jgi:pimeloyl-ACP methyl ester carboxylesterase/quercetin dioxygenase-like cupin family protein